MAAPDYAHDLKSFDRGRRVLMVWKPRVGRIIRFEATMVCFNNVFRYFDVRCFVSWDSIPSHCNRRMALE